MEPFHPLGYLKNANWSLKLQSLIVLFYKTNWSLVFWCANLRHLILGLCQLTNCCIIALFFSSHDSLNISKRQQSGFYHEVSFVCFCLLLMWQPQQPHTASVKTSSCSGDSRAGASYLHRTNQHLELEEDEINRIQLTRFSKSWSFFWMKILWICLCLSLGW